MADLNKTLLYRMTHIKNMAHIVQHGITHINSPNANHNYVPIGDGSLIETRATRQMEQGKMLGDYIPFYFGYRMPMLYVIQKGFNGVKMRHPKEIIYCVSSIAEIQVAQLDFIYTDGHARDELAIIYNANNLNGISSQLDWNAIGATYWNNSFDTKFKKQAEFLVGDDIPYNALRGFAVYDEEAKTKIQTLGVTKKIVVEPNWYF